MFRSQAESSLSESEAASWLKKIDTLLDEKEVPSPLRTTDSTPLYRTAIRCTLPITLYDSTGVSGVSRLCGTSQGPPWIFNGFGVPLWCGPYLIRGCLCLAGATIHRGQGEARREGIQGNPAACIAHIYGGNAASDHINETSVVMGFLLWAWQARAAAETARDRADVLEEDHVQACSS